MTLWGWIFLVAPHTDDTGTLSDDVATITSIQFAVEEKNFQRQKYTTIKLTLNAPIPTKVVCISRLLKCLRSLYGKQCGPRIGAVCSGSMLFASILNLSVMLGIYLQQKTLADDIFRCIFFLGTLRANKDTCS